jgi:type IV pilus assembly protein PilB
MADEPHEIATSDELADAIIGQAVRDGASDIHIDPMGENYRVRARVDGILHEKLSVPVFKMDPFLNRLKVLAGLDLSTHPVPQDGRFEVEVNLPDETGAAKPTPVATRISIFLTVEGEAIVLRLLNRQDMLVRLEDSDMDEETLSRCRDLFMKNYGMILVTGPSGSGKTTLLYSILQELNHAEKNIVTLEDPVEFKFPGMRQVQIIPDQGLTYASGMRSILRQDPDVVMIGEIRDPETAEYAVRAALVGRLVFSTVHANTGVGTIARLLDMNIERSLIAYALNGVLSKRLVRRVCDACKAPYEPDLHLLRYFNVEPGSMPFMKGTGCDACGGTGYKGRVALFEVLKFDDGIRSLIIEHASISQLQEYIQKSDMITLKVDALKKVTTGVTTLEETVRAV